MTEQFKQLLDQASQARLASYSPYSGFRVGAALLGKSGTIYLGTNVENASFGLCNCAERTAVFAAVTAGEKEFLAIAVCADGAEPTPPCGACRQVLLEFGPETVVLLGGEKGSAGPVRETAVEALLPDSFTSFHQPEKEQP
jgi:cytidine deaminase